MPLGGMRWSNLVFVHWRLRSEDLSWHVANGLRLDLREGAAYLTLVGMHGVGPLPQSVLQTPIAPLASHQLVQLRTYVVGPAGPGVLLLNVGVDRAFALAGRVVGMPYHLDTQIRVSHESGIVSVHTRGLDIEGLSMADAPPRPVEKGGLTEFLLNRIRTYTPLQGGLLYCLKSSRPSWRIRPMMLVHDVPSSAVGFGDAPAPAAAHVAEPVDIAFTDVRVLRTRDAPLRNEP